MLKPHREITDESIQYYCNQVGERGGIVAHSTGWFGTGAGLDDANQRVDYPTAWPSGLDAIGLKAHDTVNKDLSEQILNPYKPEAQIGDKTLVIRKGVLTTNFIKAGQASGTATHLPLQAYAGHGGYIYSGTATAAAASGWPRIGEFLTTVDAEGYATVRVDL